MEAVVIEGEKVFYVKIFSDVKRYMADLVIVKNWKAEPRTEVRDWNEVAGLSP